ncbi:hypothetical protein LMH73_007865 [Vibrio splendidus]|nr:hypothetical protein [Vibrio splendidus]MCC4883105.1 hypothetical protein [Vibrio splendidus]
MGNLILIIVSIVLVLVLAATGAYFGGHAYSNGKIDAEVGRYLNESEQVAAAVTLFESQGNEVTTTFAIESLVTDGYLKQLPEGWGLHMNTIASKIQGSEDMKASICFESNKNKGFIFPADTPNTVPYIIDNQFSIPICSNETDLSIPCCVN